MENYIQDQILEVYMEELDEISFIAMDEINSFDAIMEDVDNTPAVASDNNNEDKATSGKGGKFKEILEKLKELLDKFLGAITHIIDKIKSLIPGLKNSISSKLKVMGTLSDDVSVINFKTAYTNINTLEDISNNITNNIITPIKNGGNPKVSDIQEYSDKLDPITFKNFESDNSNTVTYKKGSTVRGNIFAGSDNNIDEATKKMEEAKNNSKVNREIVSSLTSKVENSAGNATDNERMLSKAGYLGISVNREIVKYCTKYIGDIRVLNSKFEVKTENAA